MTNTKEANNAKKEKKELISPLSFLLLLTELSNNIVVQCLFWEVLIDVIITNIMSMG